MDQEMTRAIRHSDAATVALLVLAGCANTGTSAPSGAAAQAQPEAITDPAPRPGLPSVLIAMPVLKDFIEVRRGLVPELGRSFNVSTFAVGVTTTAADLGAEIAKRQPSCLVVMNNTTVSLLIELQKQKASQTLPPAVIVMTSLLEGIRLSVKNATGIAYEVPGVTSFINLRSLMTAPLTRVGVAYRPMFRAFVEQQRKMAQREHVELVLAPVGKDVREGELRDALLKLTTKNHVDALWMLNDNGLLRSSEFIEETWRTVQRSANVPLIVGAANLVVPKAMLGTFGTIPDYEALGLQTANLIFDLADNDWRADEHAIELPLSVKTIVDLPQLRARFGLREESLRHVDIIKE
jgi:hypothetical protein